MWADADGRTDGHAVNRKFRHIPHLPSPLHSPPQRMNALGVAAATDIICPISRLASSLPPHCALVRVGPLAHVVRPADRALSASMIHKESYFMKVTQFCPCTDAHIAMISIRGYFPSSTLRHHTNRVLLLIVKETEVRIECREVEMEGETSLHCVSLTFSPPTTPLAIMR